MGLEAFIKIKTGICSECKEHSSNEYLLVDTTMNDDECTDFSNCCGAVLICECSGYDEDLYER